MSGATAPPSRWLPANSVTWTFGPHHPPFSPRRFMPDIRVRLAQAADRPVVERLWLMFRHDMSEFQGVLPNSDGTFRSDRLHAAFTDADWAPYLVTSGEQPVGFAFVRGLNGPTRVLNSFFVARGARRTGIGLRAVQAVLAQHPGRGESPSRMTT